jgi:D-alanine-D-alanine ligase
MSIPVTVLLGDPRLPDRTKPGGRYTDDDLDQVARLKRALAELPAYSFRYLDDHQRLLEDLAAGPPEFVLNFCDTGFRNDVRRELHVTAYLELLDIPYSGAGPVAIGLCYDKALVRAVAGTHGIAVPREQFIAPDCALPSLEYPAFIKPNRTDGSLGITADSIVRDEHEAAAYVERLRRELPGEGLLAQEFLCGAEYGVGIVGNPAGGLTLLPVLEVDYDALDPSLPRILDYGSKTEPTSPYWTDVRFREARLDEATRARITGWCYTLFERLQLRDYARFDFREDAGGQIKLMEVNPNPAWCWDGKLAHMAGTMGESHTDLLRRIIEAARQRCFGDRDVRRDRDR